ncbi:MAG: zinc-ribbon and FHA domain-containing protein [Acidimicrobiia bacterium]|nr:zinc-ribbon and FHA domain-containing protein [Acidimicrobiia bacterium]
MRCRRCGHENTDEANFCSSCGAPLPEDDATISVAAVEERLEIDDELEALLDDVPEGMGMLFVARGPDAGSRILLEGPRTTAGRHPDSNIFLDDVTVSRRHAEIVRSGDDYLLRDVGSLNGTYVRGERIDEATLRHGDEVQIGRYRLRFLVGGHHEVG